MAAIPIWKDYIVDLGSTSPVMFKVAGSYIGKAYASASGQNVKIRINDIYAPRVYPNTFEEVWDEDSATFVPCPHISASIYVQKSTDGGQTWVNVKNGEDYFEYDYSFSFGNYSTRNQPITGRVTPRTQIPFTFYSNGNQVDVSVMRGSTEIITCEITGLTAAVGTALVSPLDLTGQKAGDRIVFDRDGSTLFSYDVIDDCHRYALHYINPFGGMDVFIPEGETKRSAQLTRHTHGREYNNSRAWTYKGNTALYAIEQKDKLTFVSGYLTDEQSERMQYLLASPSVYVHDMVDDIFYPIVITDTNITEQTFKQNNRKMANYTINAEVALDKTRR